MKKFKFVTLALVLSLMAMLTGCVNNNNDNLERCYVKYDAIAEAYGFDDATNRYAIYNSDFTVDLYSADSYQNASTYYYISTINDNGSEYLMNTLNYGAEYQALMHGVSQLFLEWRHPKFVAKIPESQINKLELAIDKLDEVSKNVKAAKYTFELNAKNFVDMNTLAVKASLDKYLEKYVELIMAYFDVSVAYEDIYNTVFPQTEVVKLANGDIKKLLLTSELYLAKYYYLKDIVLAQNKTSRFSFKNIYDQATEKFISNPNYDKDFQTFVNFTDKDSSVSEVDESNNDKITYFNAGNLKLASLKNGIKNMEIAVEKILSNQDTTGEYAKFISDFNETVVSYQNFLTVNILV